MIYLWIPLKFGVAVFISGIQNAELIKDEQEEKQIQVFFGILFSDYKE